MTQSGQSQYNRAGMPFSRFAHVLKLTSMVDESHTSTDGALTLLVLRADGDITIGFQGYPWHTHGDVLAGVYEFMGHGTMDPEGATTQFVYEILSNSRSIYLLRIDGKVAEAWPFDEMVDTPPQPKEGESIETRYWDIGANAS